jgi:hypothetical protein
MKKLFASPLALPVLLVLLAAIVRLLTNYFHLWNFTPITAMALFCGATIRDKKLAFLIPLTTIILTDAVLGFYEGIWVVYAALLAITFLGFVLQNRLKVIPVLLGSLGTSLIFYLVTNFALFYPTWMYPHSMEGITASYTAAIPFFRNALIGDLIFSGILFGSYALLSRSVLLKKQAGIR